MLNIQQEQFEENANYFLKHNDPWFFYWKNILEEEFILEKEELEALKIIRNNHKEEKDKIHIENVKPYFKKVLKKIRNIDFEWLFYILWWWTSLTLMWVINRDSDDIDIFCKENDIIYIKEKFEKEFWVGFLRNDFNWAYFARFNLLNWENFKIEIVPYNKLMIPVEIDWIIFSSAEVTLMNKFEAVMTREARRDIYDLAVFYFKRYELFNKYINKKIAKRIYSNKDTIFNNKPLIWVLKNKEDDFKILNAFFKYLEIRYNLKENIN